jgi:hypothetical protein
LNAAIEERCVDHPDGATETIELVLPSEDE